MSRRSLTFHPEISNTPPRWFKHPGTIVFLYVFGSLLALALIEGELGQMLLAFFS